MMRFFVDGNSIISSEDFDFPITRNHCYESVADDWYQSPEALLAAMSECEPLAAEVHSLYDHFRNEIIESLQEAETKSNSDRQLISILNNKLKNLPEDPYDGVAQWLNAMAAIDFDETVIPPIEQWFCSEPDWVSESEYVQEKFSSQGSAYIFFRDLEFVVLKQLGIVIVEGEFPGSSYYAAELRGTIDEANEQAHKLKLDIVFEKK